MNDSENYLLTIYVYSHGLKLTYFNYYIKQLIYRFCDKLKTYTYKREYDQIQKRYITKKVEAGIYAGANSARNIFYFHKNHLEELLLHFERNGVNRNSIKIIQQDIYTPDTIELESISSKTPRDYQHEFIDYIVNPGCSKVINLQTGKGKTFIFCKAIEQIKQRTAIVIKWMYVEKWVGDLKENFNLKDEDIMVVKGSENLETLINLGLEKKLKAKFILISNSTLRNFYDSYCNDQFFLNRFKIDAFDLWKTLGVGVRLVDEGHLDFHFNFKQDLFTNIPKTVTLSATLDSDNSFINKMTKVMFPNIHLSPKIEDDRYIKVKTIFYNLRDIKKIKYKNVFNQYTHIKFEQSIMKDLNKLKNYVKMIEQLTENLFVSKKEKNQKFLIFFATIDLCTIVTEKLKNRFPNLIVKRKVGQDDLDDLLNADIAVSTLKSAGTAFDIPNLAACLCTVAVSGKQINQQAIGRLRRLKEYPDLNPEFYFLACNQVKKHIDYANEKEMKIGSKILSYASFNSSFEI